MFFKSIEEEYKLDIPDSYSHQSIGLNKPRKLPKKKRDYSSVKAIIGGLFLLLIASGFIGLVVWVALNPPFDMSSCFDSMQHQYIAGTTTCYYMEFPDLKNHEYYSPNPDDAYPTIYVSSDCFNFLKENMEIKEDSYSGRYPVLTNPCINNPYLTVYVTITNGVTKNIPEDNDLAKENHPEYYLTTEILDPDNIVRKTAESTPQAEFEGDINKLEK